MEFKCSSFGGSHATATVVSESVFLGHINRVGNLKVLKRLQINLIKFPVNILYLLCKLALLLPTLWRSTSRKMGVAQWEADE